MTRTHPCTSSPGWAIPVPTLGGGEADVDGAQPRIAGRPATLPRRAVIDTRDVAEAETAVGELLHARARVRLDRPDDHFRVRVAALELADLRLVHFRYGEAFSVRSGPLPGYAVNLTLAGCSRTQRGADSVDAAVDEASVISPTGAFSVGWSRDTEVLCLMIPETALEQHLRKLTGGPGPPVVFGPRTEARTARMLYSVIGTALEVSEGESGGVPSSLAWQLREAVLTAMLLDLPHDRRAEMSVPRGRAERLCEAAEALMRDTVTAPLPVPSLAARLGVSERSLQTIFREHRRETPSARFKQLRLDAVRDALVHGRPDRHTVAGLADEAGGFSHHGRFAAEYLERFGERPSQTLRRC